MLGLLIVDDEEGIRRSIERALARENYKVYTAQNGHEAIALVQENPGAIAVVISDYKMPGLDGLQTLAAIGSVDSDIARIILTGYATLEVAIQATNEGVDGFLTKPFDNNEIRIKIREYFVKKHLKQMVSQPVLMELQKNPEMLRPRKAHGTVLFADIRNFSRVADTMEPEVLADILNRHYFSPLGEIIFRHRGMVDKYIGDGIMALFGVPLPSDTDALQAVAATVEMQASLQEANAEIERDTGHSLGMGIGVATGSFVCGVFGSKTKRDYTALGSVVNIAARLQATAKAGEIFITEDTYHEVKNGYRAEHVGAQTLKGIKEPVNVYRVLGAA